MLTLGSVGLNGIIIVLLKMFKVLFLYLNRLPCFVCLCLSVSFVFLLSLSISTPCITFYLCCVMIMMIQAVNVNTIYCMYRYLRILQAWLFSKLRFSFSSSSRLLVFFYIPPTTVFATCFLCTFHFL